MIDREDEIKQVKEFLKERYPELASKPMYMLWNAGFRSGLISKSRYIDAREYYIDKKSWRKLATGSRAFHIEKMRLIKIANDLYYGEEAINKIKEATTEDEIDCIMRESRIHM